ncbi:hypothetical protein QUF64_15695 [Anaerolineales bacterium HSG6]|nr:hypothetical protein [Anaerolineales bacterium HSG6]
MLKTISKPFPKTTVPVLLVVILAFAIGMAALIRQVIQQTSQQVKTQQEQVTAVPPLQPYPDSPDDDGEPYITFLHLTTEQAAQEILATGIQPLRGERSGNDLRFFAVTQESGPLPRPTNEQINDMLGSIEIQLRRIYDYDKLVKLYIRLPRQTVDHLELSHQLYYGPFFPHSAPRYTESIFELASFSTINQYRYFWYYE